jgi:4-carboxymuconolactone decarboxylase
MRLQQPRIAPLTRDEVEPAIADAFPEGPGRNVIATFVRHMDLVTKWGPFAGYLMSGSTLSARDRELAILRVGWLSQSEYQWAEHVGPALEAGLSRDEIERVPLGADASGWNATERAILEATDELHADAFISDATWSSLEGFSDKQKMDLIFTVGQYMTISMALNSLGVQLEPGVSGFPEHVGSKEEHR